MFGVNAFLDLKRLSIYFNAALKIRSIEYFHSFNNVIRHLADASLNLLTVRNQETLTTAIITMLKYPSHLMTLACATCHANLRSVLALDVSPDSFFLIAEQFATLIETKYEE